MDEGSDEGAYFHEYFLRGRPDLLLHIRRLQPRLMRHGLRRIKPPARVWSPNFRALPLCRELSSIEIKQLVHQDSESTVKARRNRSKRKSRAVVSADQGQTSPPPSNSYTLQDLPKTKPGDVEHSPHREFFFDEAVSLVGLLNFETGCFHVSPTINLLSFP